MTVAGDRASVPSLARAALADGATLAYQSWPGPGLTMLDPLIYGITLDGLTLAHGQAAFLRALRAGYHLVTYDQRGFGASAAAGPPQSWEQRGADLWAVADAAGVERAVLYGVFDGGYTIAQAAVQQPERVLGLIFNFVPPTLVAGAGDASTGDASGVPAAAIDAWVHCANGGPCGQPLLMLRAFGFGEADALALAQAWETTARPEVVAAQARLMHGGDLRPLLPRLTPRALVIEPQRRDFFRGWGGALAARLPHARLVRPTRSAEMLGAIHAFLATLGVDVGRRASVVPPSLSGTLEASERTVGTLRRIVVPVEVDVPAGRAVELACRLGAPQQARIILAHVLEVPHTLPLDQPPRAAVARGERALRLGEAIVARHGLPSHTRLVIDRSAAGAIVRLAQDEQADLIVMANPESRVHGADPVGETVHEVMRRAPCEVLIDRGAGQTMRQTATPMAGAASAEGAHPP